MTAKKDFNETGKPQPFKLPEPMDIWKMRCWFDQNGVKHCQRHWVPT